MSFVALPGALGVTLDVGVTSLLERSASLGCVWVKKIGFLRQTSDTWMYKGLGIRDLRIEGFHFCVFFFFLGGGGG